MMRGKLIAQCGYLSQIASMADASEVITDGPLLWLRDDQPGGGLVWVPLDADHRAHAVRQVA